MWCFVSLFPVVSNSAVDCLERLVSDMTCYVSSGMLNLLTHSIVSFIESGGKSQKNSGAVDVRDNGVF